MESANNSSKCIGVVSGRICSDNFLHWCIRSDGKCVFLAPNGMVLRCSLSKGRSCYTPKKAVVSK